MSNINKLVVLTGLILFVFIGYSWGIGIVSTHDTDVNTSGTAYNESYHTGENINAASMSVLPYILLVLAGLFVVVVFKSLL